MLFFCNKHSRRLTKEHYCMQNNKHSCDSKQYKFNCVMYKCYNNWNLQHLHHLSEKKKPNRQQISLNFMIHRIMLQVAFLSLLGILLLFPKCSLIKNLTYQSINVSMTALFQWRNKYGFVFLQFVVEKFAPSKEKTTHAFNWMNLVIQYIFLKKNQFNSTF